MNARIDLRTVPPALRDTPSRPFRQIRPQPAVWLDRLSRMRISSSPPASRLIDVSISTFGILALELGLIRWISGQIRIVAYFTNLILLAAFLGMGLGVALGRRRTGLVHLALPALALL